MVSSRPRGECSRGRQDTDRVTGLCSLNKRCRNGPCWHQEETLRSWGRLVLRGQPASGSGVPGRGVGGAPASASVCPGRRPSLPQALARRKPSQRPAAENDGFARASDDAVSQGSCPCSAPRAVARAVCRARRRRGVGAPAGSPLLVPRLLHGPAWASSHNGSWAPGALTGAGRGLQRLSPLSLGSGQEQCPLIRPRRRAPRKTPHSASPRSPPPPGPRALPGGTQPARVLGECPARPRGAASGLTKQLLSFHTGFG